MAKQNKIQVSTIDMIAAVQVIKLNTQFVAKAIRAQYTLQDIMCNMSPATREDCMPVITFIDELVSALLDEENEAEQLAPEINDEEE